MQEKLRLYIDGEWSAEEFSKFFASLQSLSYYWIADMEYRFAPPRASERSIGRLRQHNAQLMVKRIEFASPGFTDLAGFGAILSEIRQFVEFLITHVSQTKDRRQARELKDLEILKEKIALANQLERSDLQHSVAKLIEAKDVDALIEAVAHGRLVGSEIFEIQDANAE